MSKIEPNGWYCNCPDCEVDMFVTTLGDVKEQIDYCPHDLLVLPSYSQGVIDTLTSELEAERKAKEEAIECIRLAYENDLSWEARAVMMDNKCMERAKDRLGNFLKTHTVSKGEK